MFTMGVIILYILIGLPRGRWESYGAAGRWVLWLKEELNEGALPWRIVMWSAILFFTPMLCLGTVSPQVTRLAVSDWEHAGRVAGRVYAWSCAGAIAGTFATGYVLVRTLGVNNVIFVVSLGLLALSAVVGRSWKRPGELLISAVIAGAAIIGMIISPHLQEKYDLETNYYAIHTSDITDDNGLVIIDENGLRERKLVLDHLIHS